MSTERVEQLPRETHMTVKLDPNPAPPPVVVRITITPQENPK